MVLCEGEWIGLEKCFQNFYFKNHWIKNAQHNLFCQVPRIKRGVRGVTVRDGNLRWEVDVVVSRKWRWLGCAKVEIFSVCDLSWRYPGRIALRFWCSRLLIYIMVGPPYHIPPIRSIHVSRFFKPWLPLQRERTRANWPANNNNFHQGSREQTRAKIWYTTHKT